MRRLLLATLVALVAAITPLAPAQAAARISVTNDRGTSMADVDYRTPLTLRASGFQAVKGGFGGVYVAFGWVKDPGGGSWRPSRGGITGRDYRYVPDSESEGNQGYLRFVAFPGSSTADEAHAVMSAAGGFTVTLTVPGPVFNTVDRDGDVVRVDCRQVTCGVITFGAHGVRNAANESFTPVRFGDVYGAATPSARPTGSATPGGDEAGTDSGATTGDDTETAAGGETSGSGRPSGKPQVSTDRGTAQAGQALAFTGRGFQPGEQVLAVLDDGVVAVGPLLAGTSGEIAGVLALPVDLPAGTHELRLVGAASGAEPRQRFPVKAAAVSATAAETADVAEADDSVAPIVFVVVAGLLFLLSLAFLVSRLLRRRPATAEEVAT